jgi:hypothetical protein
MRSAGQRVQWVGVKPGRKSSVTTASGQDRYTNSQKASYIAHSAIVHYPAIYMRYKLYYHIHYSTSIVPRPKLNETITTA